MDQTDHPLRWYALRTRSRYEKLVREQLANQGVEFYISLTCMIIGSQMFLAGFIGELVARNAHERNHYLIEEKVNIA